MPPETLTPPSIPRSRNTNQIDCPATNRPCTQTFIIFRSSLHILAKSHLEKKVPIESPLTQYPIPINLILFKNIYISALNAGINHQRIKFLPNDKIPDLIL